MNNKQQWTLAALVGFFAVIGPLGRTASAFAGGDAADVAAIRRADADWAAALLGAGADAWLDFYASDAIVVLPGEPLASGRNYVRDAVTLLLARPHLRLSRHAETVEISRSGNLAYVNGSYELRFASGTTGPNVAPGRLVEIWRKQTDGTWKCIVDTWNPSVVAAPGLVGAAPMPMPATPSPTPPQAPTAAADSAAASSGMPTADGGQTAKYGAIPTNYTETIKQYFQTHLKYPDSVKYREITRPESGSLTHIAGVLMHETRQFGWTVQATISAVNNDGDNSDWVTYTFLFRGENLVYTQLPSYGAPH